MKLKLKAASKVYIAPALISLCITLCLLVSARKPEAIMPKVHKDEPFVSLVFNSEGKSNPLVLEQSLLMDSQPIFLPTLHNAGTKLPTLTEQQDVLFDDFPPLTGIRGTDTLQVTQLDTPSISTPKETLIPQNRELFSSFGTQHVTNSQPSPLPQRSAYLTVYSLSNDELVEELPLEIKQFPHDIPLWEPTELLVLVNESGVIGHPQLIRSTTDEVIDGLIREQLQSPSILDNLPEGYYKVVVGP